jgi:signal transduction histidine kinase
LWLRSFHLAREIPLAEYLREMKLNYEVWVVASDLPTIVSDKAKLTIILQNLIANAIIHRQRIDSDFGASPC